MPRVYEAVKFIKEHWKACLILALTLCFNVILVSSVGGARREFLNKNEELNALTAKSSNILELKKKYEDIESISAELDKSFLNDSNVVDFIVFIENMARSTGNSVAIKSITEDNQGKSKAFRVELRGTFGGFVNFVAQLENSPQLSYPVRIDIKEYTDPETKVGVLKSSLDIKALSL